jgi:trigger factor
MNITRESTGNLTATIQIDIVKADYQQKLEEKLREYRKKMKMPGFREGKVPMGVVNKMYGKALLADVINTMVSESLENHLEESELGTLASPLHNMEKQQLIDFDTQEDFSFFFDIALRPEVHFDLDTLEGIDKYMIEPDEKSVEEYIAQIRKSFGTYEPAEKVSEEDMLHCEIDEVNDAGEKFNGGIHSHGHLLVEKISNGDIRKNFIGAGVGTVVRMNPMEAFGNRAEVASLLNIKSEELHEPMNQFDFEITKIDRRIPADIDEKVLAEVFPNDHLQNEAELRERVKRDIADSYNKEAEMKMFNDTLDILMKTTDIPLPDDFMKRWLMENEEGEKSTKEDLEANYDSYASQLRIALLRNELIKKYQIRVNEEDMILYVVQALGMGNSMEELPEEQKQTVLSISGRILKDKKQAEKIGEQIMEKKISDVIRTHVPYAVKQVTSEEFKQIILQ